jgi:hypothetical protein
MLRGIAHPLRRFALAHSSAWGLAVASRGGFGCYEEGKDFLAFDAYRPIAARKDARAKKIIGAK